jgi:hypothetical protein
MCWVGYFLCNFHQVFYESDAAVLDVYDCTIVSDHCVLTVSAEIWLVQCLHLCHNEPLYPSNFTISAS